MPRTEDPELNSWILEKQILARKENRGEITKEEFRVEYDALEAKIRQRNQEIIEKEISLRQKRDEEEERRIETMPEEVKKKEKVERKPKEGSRASVILEVLQMKSVKDLNTATDKVVEKMPGQKPENVKAQITAIIKLVEKGQGRFAKYSWDKTNFRLTAK